MNQGRNHAKEKEEAQAEQAVKDALAEGAAERRKTALDYGKAQGVLKALQKQAETNRRNQEAKELEAREEVSRKEIEEALSRRKAEDIEELARLKKLANVKHIQTEAMN